MSEASASGGSPVTIVTQTRVQAGKEQEFLRWQDEIAACVAGVPGFIKQTVIRPNPPGQVDWVVLQLFTSSETAVAWLHSEQRTGLLQRAQSLLAGPDDVHIVADRGPGALPAPVSAVISTRIKPGQEGAYRQWEQRIAAAQAKSPGFQGYRFEPPIPGVQEDWLAILRFDNERNLQGWLDSPARHKLLKESDAFTEEVHARIVRTGFDQWFPMGSGSAAGPAAWKMNMIVLLLIYPIVFLFSLFVQTPILMARLHLPFWFCLFLGNIVSVLVLDRLVPWASRRLDWWLRPSGVTTGRTTLAGAGLIVALYALSLVVFSQL